IGGVSWLTPPSAAFRPSGTLLLRFASLCEHETVDEFAVLEIAGALAALVGETGFFEDACGGGVARVDGSEDADEIEVLECPLGEGGGGFGGDSAAPERFAEPVAELGGVA